MSATAKSTGRSLAGPLSFPHTTYAEDQPLSKTILYYHVLLRAIPTGATLAIPSTLIRHFILRRPHPLSLPYRLLSSSFYGVTAAVGISALATVGRMWGRDEIEWKDRSWRLLENRRQNEVDGWSLGALVVGGAGGWFLGMRKGAKLGVGRTMVGGAGLASVAATGLYMVNRYGINGGMYPDERKEIGV